MSTGLPDPSQSNMAILFVPRTILSQTPYHAPLHCSTRKSAFSPQNASHLTSSFPHCSVQCHCCFMSGMLLLHLYPVTVPSEITMILSKYESNIPLLCFNPSLVPSPLKESHHTYRDYNLLRELGPTTSQNVSVSSTSL